MIQKKFENFLKKVLPVNRYLHRKICAGTGLSLDYALNREAIDILVSIFIHREYADYFPKQQSATIVDVGGHFGFFAFFTALNTAPDSLILSLEPSPENFTVLQQNLKNNPFSNIRIFNLGLDEQSGERTFYGGRSYNHSFYAQQPQKQHSVRVLTLKDLIAQQQLTSIDFLKLDCEGAEFPILLSADREALDKVKTIFLEFHDLPQQGFSSWQIIDHLQKNGFEIVRYQHDPDYSFDNLNFGKIIATKPA